VLAAAFLRAVGKRIRDTKDTLRETPSSGFSRVQKLLFLK
jgi:hypothetical protein